MFERIGGSLRNIMTSQLGLDRPSLALRVDAALALLAGLVTGGFALWLFFKLDFALMLSAIDIWLDSDPARIIASLQSRSSDAHFRSNVHPLWSVGVALPFVFLTSLVGVKAMTATYVAISGAVFGAFVFAALRLMGLQRLDTFLLLGLCLSTSSAWLWLGIPETFALGAASLLVPLIWLAAPRGLHDRWTGPAQSLISFSITITNWSAGILAAFLALGLRRSVQTTIVAFAIAGFLAIVQYRLFIESGAFLDVWSEHWADYGLSGTLWQHAQTFFLSTIAAPTPDLAAVDHTLSYEFGERYSRLQFSTPTESPAGIVTLLLWYLIAARGVWAAANGAVQPKIALFVGAIIGFNLILHALYGIETFLYAMHFLPFFTFVAAWSLLLPGPGRAIMRVAIVAAIALGSLHNLALFNTMAEWHNSLPVEVFSSPSEVGASL
ncbi:MAG: hypothetical protein RLO80_06680 [Hyphomonas sp.]